MEEINHQSPGVNPAHKLRGKLQANSDSLRIARIPPKTKEQFVKLSEEEFCGDYGMCLKWVFDDMPSQDTRVLIAKIEELESRIVTLENSKSSQTTVEPVRERKMCDGTKRIGGKE